MPPAEDGGMEITMKKLISTIIITVALATISTCNIFAGQYDINSNKAEGADKISSTEAKEAEADIVSMYYTTQPVEDAQFVALAAKDAMSSSKVTYTNAPQLSRFVQLGYWLHYGYFTNNVKGSISVSKAVLKSNNTNRDVYVVSLSGTDLANALYNQSTGIFTDLLCGFQIDNTYARNVKKVILDNIPSGANIVFIGHSLGGMVAQQCSADSKIKSKYNVINTLAFGSPIIGTSTFGLYDYREGSVSRLGDTRDLVPYLSSNTLNFSFAAQIFGLKRENGGYSAYQIISSHCYSYQREEVWGKYDVLGNKNGNATITMDFSTTKWFESPFILCQ